MGERWRGLLHAYCNNSRSRVMASLCCSPSRASLLVPSSNAIFLMGDKVENTGNAVIDRLSQLDNIAAIVVSKLGPTVNAWVVEPPHYFRNAFGCYDNLMPALTASGDPIGYRPEGFPAATGLLSLQTDCLAQVKAELNRGIPAQQSAIAEDAQAVTQEGKPPRTVLFGFSKGGIVLNQLLAELAYARDHAPTSQPTSSPSLTSDSGEQLLSSTVGEFLNSIEEVHYVDVGLNCRGAYQTDAQVLETVAKAASTMPKGLQITLHGTPRQWKDHKRRWIAKEKDRCITLLKDSADKYGHGKLQVSERWYFLQEQPSLQMHFQIIESLIVT